MPSSWFAQYTYRSFWKLRVSTNAPPSAEVWLTTDTYARNLFQTEVYFVRRLRRAPEVAITAVIRESTKPYHLKRNIDVVATQRKGAPKQICLPNR